MRRVGHVAGMGERSGVYRVVVGNLRERDHLADLDIDARMLKWVFEKWGGRLGLEWYGWQADVNTVMNLLVP